MGKYSNFKSTRQLKKSLFLYLASALLVVTVSFSFVIYFILFEQLKKAEDHKLFHASEMQAIAVNQWARRAKDLALQITSRTRIRQELSRYNRGEISLEDLRAFTKTKLDDAMNLAGEITGIARIANDRSIVSLSGDAENFQTISDFNEYIPEKVKIYDPFKTGNRELIIVSAPILNKEKEREGTDIVFMDTFMLKKIVSPETAADRIDVYLGMFSEKGFTLLGKDRDSDVYKSLKNKYFDVLFKASHGEKGILEIGREVAVYSPVCDCRWGIAAVSNRSSLYSSLYRKLLLTSVSLVAVYLVTLSGFSFLMRPFAGRILMHSNELEERIREKTSDLENEVAERIKSEKEKERVIRDLELASGRINKLQGLLPICSVCKKIRDDRGYWNQLETYISENSDADFSHGFCPECYEKAKKEMSNFLDKI